MDGISVCHHPLLSPPPPPVDQEPYASISAFVAGDIDLDIALKQIDAAWPDLTLAPLATP